MRFHRFCWPLVSSILLATLLCLCTHAAQSSGTQTGDADSGSALGGAVDTITSEDTIRAKITDALRRELDAEPPPELVNDAVARATRIRSDAQIRLYRAEQIAAREVADEIRKEGELLLDIRRGNTMAMLRRVSEAEAHPFELLTTLDGLAAIFGRHTHGPTVYGPDWDWQADEPEPVPDGATLTFPAGVHACDMTEFGHGPPLPKDVVLQGAGMDQTLLRLRHDILAWDGIYNLTFRDMTIDCGSRPFARAVGDAPGVVRLERCRVVGFDSGAGGSNMLGGGTMAFWAEGCVFEIGYGRSPSHGVLFDVRGCLLARLDGCTLRGPFTEIYRAGPHATCFFSDCKFEDMSEQARDWIETPEEGVRFERCMASYLSQDQQREMYRRDSRPLTDLNAEWVVEDEWR